MPTSSSITAWKAAKFSLRAFRLPSSSRMKGRTVNVVVVARRALAIDIIGRLGMPATLIRVARLGTDGNLGTIRYVAEDGGDKFGVGDRRNSGFTTFSTFGRWYGRRFRGGKQMPSL